MYGYKKIMSEWGIIGNHLSLKNNYNYMTCKENCINWIIVLIKVYIINKTMPLRYKSHLKQEM